MSMQMVKNFGADTGQTRLTALMRIRHEIESTVSIDKAERELRIANAKLLISNRKLAAANADLEAFSYSVAHDLRSPIRQIAGFSKLLMEDYGDQLPDEAQHYLGKVRQGAHQMGLLIDDLLHLAQVGRQPLRLEIEPLLPIVAAAQARVLPECADRDIWWRINELASVACNRGLLEQVFFNLLSNAAKYTREREYPLIEVGQLQSQGAQVFFVRDNGIGFDMKYADKLFGVFQRLHPAAKFEGTGVGLAIVERIVRKHGGHIWAEAEPELGATFFFTLPAADLLPL